jgi:hypothetical protein
MTQDPLKDAPSLVKERSFFRLRRRRDKIGFFAGIASLVFSAGVFVYKLWIEAPPSVVPADVQEASIEVEEDPEFVPPAEPPDETLPPPLVSAAPAAEPTPPKPAPKTPPAPKKPPKPKAVPYEAFKARNPWQAQFDKGGRASVRFDDAEGMPFIQLTFDLQDGKWIQASQELAGDFSAHTRLKFAFKGAGDEGNNVELLVADQDGTAQILTFTDKAHITTWTPVDVPLSSLKQSRRGADGKMNWGKVARLVLRVSGHSWTKGTVWYQNVRFE